GVAALICLVAASGDAAQNRHARPAETDETVPASRGMRLALENAAGSVEIHAWDSDAVRIQARHASRTKVLIRTGENAVTITASASGGPAGSVDYDITAPSWMAMRIEGQYDDVTIEGTRGDVSVETVRGDITIRGGSSSVTAKTIEGQVVVEGARGKVDVSSVNEGITITGAGGEISAETTNGSIRLARIDATSVDVATINGDVTFDGTLSDNGRYSFNSHNGDIVLTVPETSNATFNVRTYNGEFSTTLALKGPDPSGVRRGKRVSYTLGSGGADVDLESFGGEISVRRAGSQKTGRRQ
ncbi:MAG: hypothetical protein V7647_2412, partial [Acidobacteriota bacterium]